VTFDLHGSLILHNCIQLRNLHQVV